MTIGTTSTRRKMRIGILSIRITHRLRERKDPEKFSYFRHADI